jgi:hypothetical protein
VAGVGGAETAGRDGRLDRTQQLVRHEAGCLQVRDVAREHVVPLEVVVEAGSTTSTLLNIATTRRVIARHVPRPVEPTERQHPRRSAEMLGAFQRRWKGQ